MRTLFTFLSFIIFLSFQLAAQITINSSDFNAKAGDTISVKSLTLTALISMYDKDLPDQTLDYSKLESLSSGSKLILNTNDTEFFPEASFTYDNYYVIFNKSLNTIEYEQIKEDGYYALGFYTDTLYHQIAEGAYLIVPHQVVNYEPTYQKLSFPIQYTPDKIDTFNCSRMINGFFTYPALGLQNAPVGMKVTYQRIISVKSWGQLKSPSISEYVDFIRLNVSEFIRDSIYLNGSPADPTMLTALGLKQGNYFESASRDYYAKGYNNPLLRHRTYALNSEGSIDGYYLVVKNTSPVDEEINIVEFNNSKAFPNPVRNNTVNINFQKNDDTKWNIEVINQLGQSVSFFDINEPIGNINMSLSLNNNPNGVYFYKIYNSNKNILYSGKFVVSK